MNALSTKDSVESIHLFHPEGKDIEKEVNDMTLRESIEKRLQRLKELERARRRHRVTPRAELQIRSFSADEFRSYDPEEEPGLEGWDTEDMEPDERFNLIESIVKDLLHQIEQMETELDGAEKAIKILCRILDAREHGLALNDDERHALIMFRSCGLMAGRDVGVIDQAR